MYLNFSVDVEANGACPGLYSMIEIGAVCLETDDTFHSTIAPITDLYNAGALQAIGVDHTQTLCWPRADQVMQEFCAWLNEFKRSHDDRLVFWSDNPAFDWQFVNYYLHRYAGENPFGFSARRIGDLYAGLKGNPRKHTQWKKLRTQPHTHRALDDALGNAGALKKIFKEMSDMSDVEQQLKQQIEQQAERIQELEKELDISRAFYDLTVKERDYERFLVYKLEQQLKLLSKESV